MATAPKGDSLPHETTIVWGDPAVVYAAHARMSSIELFRAMKAGKVPFEPTMSLLGANIHAVAPAEVTFTLDIGEQHLDHTGHVQAGILVALTDTAAGYAVHTRVPVGVRCASVELQVSLIEPVPLSAGRIFIHGRALHVGSRVANCEATVTAAVGTPHARMTMVMIVTPARSA